MTWICMEQGGRRRILLLASILTRPLGGTMSRRCQELSRDNPHQDTTPLMIAFEWRLLWQSQISRFTIIIPVLTNRKILEVRKPGLWVDFLLTALTPRTSLCSAFLAFEYDGMMTGYPGCGPSHATGYPQWRSTESNGGALARGEACPVGKYGYDAR